MRGLRRQEEIINPSGGLCRTVPGLCRETAVDMVFLLLHGFETFLASPWQK